MKRSSSAIETLKKCSLFNGLEPGIWSGYANKLVTLEMQTNESVYHVGDVIPGLFVIESGAVQFELDFIDGYSSFITLFKEGQFFGDYELFDTKPGEDLARMAGLTRTAISTPLKTWKERGWIEIANRQIRVLCAEKLRKLI